MQAVDRQNRWKVPNNHQEKVGTPGQLTQRKHRCHRGGMQDCLDSNNSCADLGRKRHSMDWYNPDASMDVLFPGIYLKVAVLQVEQQQLDIDLNTHLGMFGLECSCLGCQSRRKQYYHRQEDKCPRVQEVMEVSR